MYANKQLVNSKKSVTNNVFSLQKCITLMESNYI